MLWARHGGASHDLCCGTSIDEPCSRAKGDINSQVDQASRWILRHSPPGQVGSSPSYSISISSIATTGPEGVARISRTREYRLMPSTVQRWVTTDHPEPSL